MKFNGLDLDLVPLDSDSIKTFDREMFVCGDPSVDEYFQKYARKHSDQNYSRTFVLKERASRKAIGFFTLCPSLLATREIPVAEKRGLPTRDMPAMLLAQFGVDKTVRGTGFGLFLLLQAIIKYSEATEIAGGKILFLDLGEPGLSKFYSKLGFVSCLMETSKMFLTSSQAKKIKEESTMGGDEDRFSDDTQLNLF